MVLRLNFSVQSLQAGPMRSPRGSFAEPELLSEGQGFLQAP